MRFGAPVRNERCAWPLLYRDQESAVHQILSGHLRLLRLIQIPKSVSSLNVQSSQLEARGLKRTLRTPERLDDPLSAVGAIKLPRHPDVVRCGVGRQRVVVAVVVV